MFFLHEFTHTCKVCVFWLSSTKALPELRWEAVDSRTQACPFGWRHCHMSKVRSKDFLDGKDYAKMLKGNVPELRDSEFNVLSTEKLCENYRDFLVDVAERTQRINEGPLRDSAMKAFEISPAKGNAFAKRLAQAFRDCVDKSRSFSNGKRLPPAVAAVVQVLVARKRQATRLNLQKTVKKDSGTVGKRRSSSSTTLSSPPPASLDKKVNLPLPGTPDKASKLRTPEKPRKNVFKDASPLWSLPGTPADTPQRGMPAKGASQGLPASAAKAATEAALVPRRCTPLKKPAAKASAEEALVPLHTPLKRPAAQSGPHQAARGMKRPARAGPSDPEAPLHKVTVVTTVKSRPIRSYVQACTATPHGSKRLIAEFSSAQCSNHAELAQKVKATIETERLGYSAARRLREQYLQQQAK